MAEVGFDLAVSVNSVSFINDYGKSLETR